jgi:hypothetical protein
VIDSLGTGAHKIDNSSLWYDVEKGSSLTKYGIAATTCTTNGACTSAGLKLSVDWMKLFLLRNASADLSDLGREEYERFSHDAIAQY